MTRTRLVAAAAFTAVLVVSAAALGFAGADQTAPTLTLSQPVGGTTLTGTTTISAAGADNVGVASVQFLLDGSNLGAPVIVAPYQVSWDTTTASNATHTVSAVATDTSGNSATVNATITVANASPPPPPPPSIVVSKVFDDSDGDRQLHTFQLNAPIPAGDTLILTHVSTIDASDGGIVTPNGVTDSGADIWHQDAVSQSGGSSETVEVWSAVVTFGPPAGATVSIQGYPRGLSSEVAIFDVAGIAGVDQSAAADGTWGYGYGISQSTPYVTTSQPHELLVGVHGQSAAAAPWWTPETVSPAWTKWTDQFDGLISRGIAVEMREVTTVGSYRAAGEVTQPVTGNNLLVTYLATG